MTSLLLRAAAWCVLMTISCITQAADVAIGSGKYAIELHPGGERVPPHTVYRTASQPGPVPTNKWYSSLLFSQWSQPLFAHPASYQAGPEGFQICLPRKRVSMNSAREENDIVYPHNNDLTVAPLAFKLDDAKADKASDWAVRVAMGDGTDTLTATIAHGSPFSYYRVSRGDVKITADGPSEIFYRSPSGKFLGLSVRAKPYAVFVPDGAHWEGTLADGLTLHLPKGAHYFSIAVLPDRTAETVIEFGKYAYAFIADTHVSWRYDEASSQVTTTFSVTTEPVEGNETSTLLGLYPHQWHDNPLLPATLPYQYDTVRGPMKMITGTQFKTRATYTGILPFWPGLQDRQQASQLAHYLQDDLRGGAESALGRPGTYWEGKGFGRAVQLMNIAEQQGDLKKRDALLKAIKARFESWLAPATESGKYFYYDRTIGTLIGYPDEFGSANEINDHHFHYGYWIFAAAQVALRDPAWAARDKWGGMIDLLAADIATTDRAHPMFPFLRNFDPYEGHSWASGIVPFYDGNNQESSSEAINAWAGLILWGEATGNKELRDTGIYLYTTEIQALNHYWFDLHHLVFAPEYLNVEASMVWGGRYTHGTWFTENPRQIHGINMLPVTTASLYLGTDPNFVKRNIEAMNHEYAKYLQSDRKQHGSPEIWQDILLEYYALHDPKEALKRWNDKGMVEEGESATHTYHWIQSVNHMGRPDFGVTADTPFYAVFRRDDGQRTYLAYNAGTETKTVRFSDGTMLIVPSRQLAKFSHR